MSDLNFIKTCAECGHRKSADQFHRKAEMPDGRRGICKQCTAEKSRIYRERFPDLVAAAKKRWARANLQNGVEASKRWRSKGAAAVPHIRESSPDTYAKLCAKWAKRRADRLRATPAWFDADRVESIYRQAGRMRRAGFDVHVDHIVPLRGKSVCGLHVHNNLRIIPAVENLQKGTKLVAI